MIICFITSTLSSGGSERVISLLANALFNRGHEIEIINLNRHIVFYTISEGIRITFAEDETGSTFIGKKILWLRSYIKDTHPDVVIPFMTDVYSVTLLSLMGISIPIISSERYDPRASSWLYKAIRWLFLRFTTHLVVQTEDIKSYYSKSIQKRTTVIYNPVTEEVFMNSFRTSGFNRINRIISVGRLAPQKNFSMMIRAFSKIASHFPDWQLVIYGEGPLRSSLETLIYNLGLEKRVFLYGRTENVIGELLKSSIFCMSTNAEGMSNALIEAMCCGLPIVSTNVSGAKELIQPPEGGIVIPVGDEGAMSIALHKLMGNVEHRRQIGENNRNRAKWFRLNQIVDRWELMLRKVVTDNMN